MNAAARPGNRLWRSYVRSPGALAGTALFLALVLAAALAPALSPHDPGAQTLSARLRPPVGVQGYLPAYPLGTDRVGRDVLSNLLHGLRVSLSVGVGAILLSALIGVPLGLVAGYFRGRVDAVIMRAADIQLSLPTVLVALGVLAVWGRGLDKLIVTIGAVGWAYYARTVRGSALSVREKEFVESARAAGMSDAAIIARHVFPNVLSPLMVLVAVELPRVVILESTLSFLGLGVPVDTPSLGIMISDGYQVLFSGRWWLSVFPGLALMAIVLSVNLIGDWLRDALDPRLAGSGG